MRILLKKRDKIFQFKRDVERALHRQQLDSNIIEKSTQISGYTKKVFAKRRLIKFHFFG